MTLTVSATGAGFTLSSAKTLTVASGQTTSAGTVTVTAVSDTTDGPDKSVLVSATASGDSGVSNPASVTLTIADDDDAPTVELSLASSSIPENGGSTTVTATLSHPSSAATTVTITAVSGFYTVGSDTMIVIASGETSNATDSVTITAVNDAIDNVVNRAGAVTGRASNARGVGAVTGASLTLVDDEGAPTATLVLSSSSISESGGVSTVTARLNRASSATVTLTVSASGNGFTLSSARTLTIAAGSTASAGAVTVTAVDDTADTPDKSVTISATVSGDSGVANPESMTLTITDDDETLAPPAALTAEAGEDQIVNEGDAVTLDGSDSSGPSGLSYAWTQTVGAPTVSLTGANTDRPSFTAPEVTGRTVLTFRLTVTAGGGSVSDLVDITVNNVAHSDVDRLPTFGDATIPDRVWTRNTAISALTLPTATDGDGALSYALSPALPAGVARDAVSHKVAGAPTVTMGETVYTWTVTDADGDAASLTFRISVVEAEDSVPTFGDATIPDRVWIRNTAISALTLPTATGGDGALTYTLSPALPAGVARDAVSHEVAGAPTVTMDETVYTWTATDTDGDAASLTFRVSVVEDLAPTFGDAAIPDRAWTRNTAISVLTLPTATGGDGALTYALSPALPAGVARDAVSHEIAGAPTVTMDETVYTWTVTDADGDTASLTFALEVWPRITLSLEDAEAVEGDDVLFILKLSPPPPGDMAVRFVVAPGTAMADADYATTPAAGGQGLLSPASAGGGPVTTYATGRAFRIAAGQTSVRIPVRTIDDEIEELRETFTINAESVLPSRTIAPATATGAIIDNDKPARSDAFAALMASFGRTLASEAVSVVEERFAGATAGTRVTLGGHALSLDSAAASGTVADDEGDLFESAHRTTDGLSETGDERSLSMQELLTESSFALSVGRSEDDPPGASVGWTIWGQAVTSGFSGRPARELETNGDVLTGFLGADARLRRDLMAGVALARSQGDMNYRLKGEDGAVDATLTSVFPYGHWAPREDLGVWAMLGAGRGKARLVDGAGTARTAIGMRMAALGWRKDLGGSGDDIAWALKGDGFAVEMESDAVEGLPATEAEARRLRLVVEGAAAWALTDSMRLRKQLEFGGRWDDGSIDKGYGAEVGGSVAWEDTGRGIEGEARGRYLLGHRSDGFKEWGASLTVRFDPGGDGVGPWISLSPQWGAPESGVGSLWGSAPEGGDSLSTAGQLGIQMGYRFDESFDTTLKFDRGKDAGDRSYGLGGRFGLGSMFDLALEVQRRESDSAPPEHSIGLNFRISW